MDGVVRIGAIPAGGDRGRIHKSCLRCDFPPSGFRHAVCYSDRHALAQHPRRIPERLSTPVLSLARLRGAPPPPPGLPLLAPRFLRHPAPAQDPVAAGLVAGSALRQIARSVVSAPNTVARISARLGRHALLLHARCLEQLRGHTDEALVLDHFESFELTQDYPFGVATAVGARSWFLYGLDPAPHGRTGRRSAAQQRRLRSRPRRRTRGRYVGSTRRVLDLLLQLPRSDEPLRLRCDAHPDYERATRSHPERRRIEVHRYPNPPRGPKGSPRSPRAIARDRAMFPVDLLHKILRHSVAHYRRETIAFNRRINAAMERLFLTAVWRNLVKKRTERRPDSSTPATRLGLTEERWNWKRVLSRRLFYDRIELPEPWPLLYRRGWTTPLLPANARHDLRRAF
jgi:hypothetical protein